MCTSISRHTLATAAILGSEQLHGAGAAALARTKALLLGGFREREENHLLAPRLARRA